MTRKEANKILKQHVGKCVLALVTRMGGKFATIYASATYEVTKTGSLKHKNEWMGCIANKRQNEIFRTDADVIRCGYVCGRPTPEKVVEMLNSGKLKFL